MGSLGMEKTVVGWAVRDIRPPLLLHLHRQGLGNVVETSCDEYSMGGQGDLVHLGCIQLQFPEGS
ncbi:hypothetical protein ACP4OV_002113 [Aristida adscensionis]